MAPWVDVFEQTVLITLFVFITMLIVDYANVATTGRLSHIMKGGRWRQYLVASILGVAPGCVGSFMNVSFYEHGLLSFGALAGGMVAASGDEAFVLLAVVPKTAFLLFGILAVLGFGYGVVVDAVVRRWSVVKARPCELQRIHTVDTCDCPDTLRDRKNLSRRILGISPTRAMLLLATGTALAAVAAGFLGPREWDWEKTTLVILLAAANVVVGSASDHYLREHIWLHLVRKHLGRLFLWTFGAMAVVNVGFRAWNLDAFIAAYPAWMLVLSVMVGMIPESGPHLVFVILFSKGMVPFSVLLANSIVQDGHGMLPLLSCSVRDAVLIKVFNLVLGLGLGAVLFFMGM